MPARRALVDCVVLSVQTAGVFYPCCKDCLSRIEVEQRDTTRCRCFKCVYSCPREQLDYRYRLSLKVTRNSCIFGLTVFGTCLNPFFGIHAKGLQRLVENSDGASNRSTLLMKAVEDCFIGRHFVFGIKVPETESLPWVGAPVANVCSSKETVHFIATQMILPNATGLGGWTVVSYYRMLLQKAASTDSSQTRGPPAATLLLIPHHFPAGSFNRSRLSASDLLSHSPPSSQCQDGTLSPTPPWEQSLGLVTSSAEPEEGCSHLSGGDEISRRTGNQEARPCAQRGSPEDHKVKEEKALSPPLSLGCFGSPSFSKYQKAVENASVLNPWISPPPRGHNIGNERGFSTRRPADTVLSSPSAWGDFPFSESLSEYWCEDNNHLDIVVETEPHLNDLQISSHGKKVSRKSNSTFQSNAQITGSQSQILLEITDKPVLNGGDRRDLPDQIYKNPVRCAFKSQAELVFTHDECNRQMEKAPLSSENEEEQLEGDIYNCSADLFGGSLLSEMTTNKLCTRAERVSAPAEACLLLSKANKQSLRSENDSLSTPNKHKRKSKKRIKRDCLFATDNQEVDFIPPTQSTPIVKVAVVRRPPASTHRDSTLAEISSRPDGHDSCAFQRNLPEFVLSNSLMSPLCDLNCVGAEQRHGRESIKENLDLKKTSSHRFTAERGLWKPGEQIKPLLTQRHPRVQRGTQKAASIGRINRKRYSSDCDVNVNDYEDGEVIIPPTPVPETRPSVTLRRRMQSGDGSSHFHYPKNVQCKKTLLETFTSSQGGPAQTDHCDSKTVEEGIQDGPRCYLEDNNNEACDWSRDLFSDSI
uniref:uncharacterized protein LOC120833025 n=1 Tax=Gasterosteus aculeatus aculeatus TaxID=481459 RepID=UPI001A982FC9|nr:uncharacterized protein LOC120833025 [Gasterosteus aculeatus aculeatus]